jgi:hypothetical protein
MIDEYTGTDWQAFRERVEKQILGFVTDCQILPNTLIVDVRLAAELESSGEVGRNAFGVMFYPVNYRHETTGEEQKRPLTILPALVRPGVICVAHAVTDVKPAEAPVPPIEEADEEGDVDT